MSSEEMKGKPLRAHSTTLECLKECQIITDGVKRVKI